MKKSVKITLWTLGGVFALAIILLAALPLWIGPVVTGIANGVVPKYTGTDFKLDSFALNPYSGKIRIGVIRLSNPKGYDEATAFSVRSVSVDLDTCSLFTKKIHIADISIEDPFVSYVYDSAGSNNFDRILASVNAKTGPAGEKTEPVQEKKDVKEAKAEPQTKLLIDRLAINGISVKYRMIKLPIPFPTLKDIGKETEGATFAEIVASVWDPVKKSFTGIGGALGNAAGLLGTGAADAVKESGKLLGNAAEGATSAVKAVGGGATDAVKGAGKVVGDGAKTVGDGAADAVKGTGKVIGDGAKAVGEGAKDAFKKVGNLFGK